MRTRFIIPTLIFLVCSVLGCNNNNLAFPTGVNGVAILQTGGGNIYPPPPISHNPLPGAIIIVQRDGGGQEIVQTADERGGFRIELTPGSYVLSAQPPPDSHLLLAPPQQTIVVLPGRLTQVVVTYASVSNF